MILTRAPLRVSFFGGGSDLPEYYESSPGAVLSTTIDVHMHIVINDSPQDRVKACYDELEVVDHASQLKHTRIREVLRAFDIDRNIEISSFCRIPTKGTGLGSSSSFTVALIKALSNRQDSRFNNYDLAEAAYTIERIKCDEKLGKQDQYAAAFGGLNLIEFDENHTHVIPVPIGEGIKGDLQNNLLFFYTGIKRTANDILQSQAARTHLHSVNNSIKEMVDLAYSSKKLLVQNKLDDFGKNLDTAWNLKKNLDPDISNNQIDEWYRVAIRAGALGGKLLGAGGGGFLMFYVPEKYQYKVRDTLLSYDLKEYRFNFSNTGAETLYAHL